jgi:putative flavoprotein involved in K+ transport
MNKFINTIIIGGGQAGLAASEHLNNNNIEHIIFERDRIVERWRSSRWDSLVANGPAWHDRFPTLEFSDADPNSFVSKKRVVEYFEEFAKKIKAPIHLNVNVEKVERQSSSHKYLVTTSEGLYEADNIIVATGAFQEPIIPKIIPDDYQVNQMHSQTYKNPEQISDGAILVIGSGSSGSQIAEELRRSNRRVFFSIGPHDRPPRRYRGRDNVWWLGVLGKWEAKTPNPGTQHVTIAVSGYDGGKTIDFRKFANMGITLLGMTKECQNEKVFFENDLKENIVNGDKNYLSLLDEADEYIKNNNLDFPEEPEARKFEKDHECITNPILELDLNVSNIKNVIWATGYNNNFEWIKLDIFDETGKPIHNNGVSEEKGLYFLGLPWLSMRGSSFIWGVWKDAKYLAEHIAKN